MIFPHKNSKLNKIKGTNISLISFMAISIVAIGILIPIVEATKAPGHDTVTSTLPSITNQISFRDISNDQPQSSSVSVDTTTVKLGFITIIVTDADADYDTDGLDVVLSSATSTTSGLIATEVLLEETGINTGTFSGKLLLSSSTQTGTLNIGAGDEITVLYDEEPPSVGRFFAEIRTLDGVGTVTLKDSNFRNTPSIDEFQNNGCLYDLYTHTVDVSFTDVIPDPNKMTVTISYANTELGDNSVVDGKDFQDLEVVYRLSEGASFISLTNNLDGHDSVAKTITSQLPPQVVFLIPPSTIVESNGNGQYALGINLDPNGQGSCFGGGGGGLVRQGFVVNALAGSGSLIGLFSGGSGGGAHPTFGDASFLVLENVSDGFGGVISEGDDISLDSTKVVQTGDTAVLRFELYENQGITNLERFKMFLNFQGENYDASTIDTHITYKRGGEITIVDPHEKFEKAEIEILQVDPWNLIVNVKIIFKNTFNTSILVDSWDLDRNSGKKLFPDVLEVVEPSILLADAQKVLNEPTTDLISEVQTQTELTEIPVWIKSNALWWQQKQIDDSDFMAGIKYLIEKTMIEVDQNDLSNSLTTKDIPVWISDVAGMWADDSLTDEEFINIMQWLISKGILQVQQ